jgi:hypothetical protein
MAEIKIRAALAAALAAGKARLLGRVLELEINLAVSGQTIIGSV